MGLRDIYVIITWLVIRLYPVSTGQVVVEGDIYIEGVFSTYKADNGRCGSVDPFSVQLQEAVKWTLEQLNTEQFKVDHDITSTFIPGLRIGLRVHDTCRSGERTKQIAFNISKQVDDTGDSVAILGPEYSSEAASISHIFSNLPEAMQLLQVGYISTATSLSDHSTYRNFFRTIPSDKIQTRTIRTFMADLKWTYVAIIHDDDIYGKEAVMQLFSQSETPTTCFPEIIPVNTSLAESEAKQFLEVKLLTLHDRTIKLEGIIIFGSRNLGYYVLDTIYSLNNSVIGYQIPVILGSEGIDFIKGTNSYLSEVTKGMFKSSPPRRFIEAFTDHWRSAMTDLANVQSDTLLSAVYEDSTSCNPSQSANCTAMTNEYIDTNLPQSYIVQYTVQAALVIAKSIKCVFSTVCKNVQGTCRKLIEEPKNSFINAMDNLEVSFDDDFSPWRIQEFRPLDLHIKFQPGSTDTTILSDGSTYTILNRRSCVENSTQFCFEKVMDYFDHSDTHQLSKDIIRDYNHDTGKETQYPNIRKPQCPPGDNCSECPNPISTGVEVTEGDMYIVGIAPIRESSDTPLTCGDVRRGGFDIAESIKFQVQEARRKIADQIPNANIGSIIIDSCSDPQIIVERILNIHKQGVLINGKYIDVKSKILGYIASWISDISIKVAEVLTRLKYVQISYGSTSPLLSNREEYPFFMRVVYSDIQQAKEMLKIIQNIGANFAQILYSETAYGNGGKNALVENAMFYNICVSNVIAVHDSEYDVEAIKDELTKENAPKVVMIFLTTPKLEELLPTLNQLTGYLMVGSEAWGTRDILKSVTNLNGSITLANELPINDNFKTHMRSLSPATSSSYWLQEYMEYYFNCYFDWSFYKPLDKHQCSDDDQFNPSPGVEGFYKIDTWVPFATTALRALLMGARKTLLQVCNTSTIICPEYYTNPNVLINNIRSLKIEYDGISPKTVFGPNNDGLISYNSYQIVIENGIASYVPLPPSWMWPYSLCYRGNEACDVCFPPPTTKPAPSDDDSELGLQAALAVFVVLNAALVVTLVLMVWAHRRKKLCFKYHDPGNTYLTTVYDTSRHDPRYRETFDKIKVESEPEAHDNRIPPDDISGDISLTNDNDMDQEDAGYFKPCDRTNQSIQEDAGYFKPCDQTNQSIASNANEYT